MAASREFELLVARIESALAPVGAVITSPDRIQDLITGQTREVDASIRYKVGSSDVLITVECRDRVKTEDVTWIEQLASKKVHIGAFHTIAVSSNSFSAPAIKAAALHGISIRTISDVTDESILDWVKSLEVEEVETSCTLGRLALIYDGHYPGAHLHPDVERDWQTAGFNARIFSDRQTHQLLSLADLVSKAVPKDQAARRVSDGMKVRLPSKSDAFFSADPLAVLALEAPRDGSAIAKTFWIDFVAEDIGVETTQGALKLVKLGFEVSMQSERRLIPATRIISYSNDQRAIADVAEREIRLPEKNEKIVITQHRLASQNAP